MPLSHVESMPLFPLRNPSKPIPMILSTTTTTTPQQWDQPNLLCSGQRPQSAGLVRTQARSGRPASAGGVRLAGFAFPASAADMRLRASNSASALPKAGPDAGAGTSRQRPSTAHVSSGRPSAAGMVASIPTTASHVTERAEVPEALKRALLASTRAAGPPPPPQQAPSSVGAAKARRGRSFSEPAHGRPAGDRDASGRGGSPDHSPGRKLPPRPASGSPLRSTSSSASLVWDPRETATGPRLPSHIMQLQERAKKRAEKNRYTDTALVAAQPLAPSSSCGSDLWAQSPEVVLQRYLTAAAVRQSLPLGRGNAAQRRSLKVLDGQSTYPPAEAPNPRARPQTLPQTASAAARGRRDASSAAKRIMRGHVPVSPVLLSLDLLPSPSCGSQGHGATAAAAAALAKQRSK
jgi:hypothetical protein